MEERAREGERGGGEGRKERKEERKGMRDDDQTILWQVEKGQEVIYLSVHRNIISSEEVRV